MPPPGEKVFSHGEWILTRYGAAFFNRCMIAFYLSSDAEVIVEDEDEDEDDADPGGCVVTFYTPRSSSIFVARRGPPYFTLGWHYKMHPNVAHFNTFGELLAHLQRLQ